MPRFVGLAALILLASAGCGGTDITQPLSGLSFTSSTIVPSAGAKSISTTATVTNKQSDPVTIHYGSCPIDVVLHNNAYNGPVEYEAASGRACSTIALEKTLGPEESLTFTENDVPGVAPGTYYVTVTFLVNGSITVTSGIVTL